MDLVSVIVPVYNAEYYLEECIESILNQSYSNFELILVNDGSTDNSLNICNHYKASDSRIKVLSKNNSGVSDTRNYGIENSLGSYICFIDSDDMIKNNYVEVLLREIKNDNVEAVFCNFAYKYDRRLIKKEPRIKSGIYHISEIRSIIIDDGTMSGILFGSVCVAIYNKSVILKNNIKFNRNIRNNEDGLFNITYCLSVNQVKILSNEYLYIYRQYERPTSSLDDYNINSRAAATEAILELCKEYDYEMNLDAQIKSRKVTEVFWMILQLCDADNKDTNRNIISKLKALLSDGELKTCYKYINTDNINKYKYIYFKLIKHQRYWLILILTKYLYPIFRKLLSR